MFWVEKFHIIGQKETKLFFQNWIIVKKHSTTTKSNLFLKFDECVKNYNNPTKNEEKIQQIFPTTKST
jgi:hypothetical protein